MSTAFPLFQPFGIKLSHTASLRWGVGIGEGPQISSYKCNNKLFEKKRCLTKGLEVNRNSFRKPNQKGDTKNMKRTLNTALLVLSLAGIFAQSTHAGIATPNGIFKITLAAGNNFIATPFARSEEGVGTITAQNGSTLTVSPISGPTSYVANAYGSNASEPYILEILDGDWIGYSAPISSTPATTLPLPSGAPSNLEGAKYAIRLDWTVESLFGAASSSQLTANNQDDGDDVEYADQIRLMGDTGTLGPVYHRVYTGGTYRWFNADEQDASKTRLPFGKGIFVKALSAKDIVLSGISRGSRTRMDIVGGKKINLLANPVPFAVKLSDSGMLINAGTSVGNADNLRLWNGTGWTSYWRNASGRWTVGSNTDASEVTIPAGSAFLIKRNSNRGDLKGSSALKFAAATVAP